MFDGGLALFRALTSLRPKDATAEVKLLGSYDPQKELIIEDPYYVSIFNKQFNSLIHVVIS